MSHTPTTVAQRPAMLDPAYVADLVDLGDEELRARYLEAQAEEEAASYVRRLLQGRLDVLRAGGLERGAGEAALVAALTAVLSTPVEEARRETPALGTTRYEHVREAAEAAVGDLALSDPTVMDAAALAEAVARLEALEVLLSAARRGMFVVLEALAAELRRRVSEGSMSPDLSLV